MFNKLLNNQIKKFFGAKENIPEALIPFLKSVSESYDDFEKRNKDLDQFAYIVSHDLKAPLRAISSLSSWLEEDLSASLTNETKDNFLLLQSRVRRMENLINGILAYSRAVKTQQLENVDTRLLVNEIIHSLDCPQHIHIDVENGLPFITTERVKLEQVLTNLISNAVKYQNKENGRIKISCVDFEDWVQFSIEDNGMGIAKNYHDKIFKIFQTLEEKINSENTGIGLAIVKKIVEEQQGKIWVESQQHTGSKFTFTWIKEKSTIKVKNQ